MATAGKGRHFTALRKIGFWHKAVMAIALCGVRYWG